MLKAESRQVLARIYGYGRGYVFTPKDFVDLASPSNIRKILTRLKKQGKIRRLARGIYEYPAYSKLLRAPASPDPDAIARAFARAYGWKIIASGQTALNLLGLSTQVPAKWEYFSDGPAKICKWSNGILVFKHRANRETTILSYKTALLVQALKTLGEVNVSKTTIAILRNQFNLNERKRALREARYATSWVYEVIKRLASTAKVSNA